MTNTIVLHIPNSEAVVGEIDELPTPTDRLITLHNPRQRDGKDLHYLESNVITVIWPISQITFIEVLPTEAGEAIIGFVRE